MYQFDLYKGETRTSYDNSKDIRTKLFLSFTGEFILSVRLQNKNTINYIFIKITFNIESSILVKYF